ncbi:hypothetical protein GUJ93_ZPchr0013g36363 [Zizania palustris]|uniref:Uncharacterized protein n=1 Tax=Zizania palustris TaxID=103762 RepID=A0A8J5X0E9_ZIZPA|nr:hypothetical protein GUJ93_ZPchr0013g36363 [Zizania palustris]
MQVKWADRKSQEPRPVFIQSLSPTVLIYAADLIDFRKITSDEYFDYVEEYVVGVEPWKDTVVSPTRDNKLMAATDLVARAHTRGMQVLPYMYRNENQFPPLPGYPPPLPGVDGRRQEGLTR